jgi:serine/threonine-protein kinase
VTSECWQQVKELFEAALERGPAERTAFLAQACEGDEEIRQEVESLLAAHEGDSSFMNTPVGHLLDCDQPMLTAGQHFGPYEEISPLGEGGMGQVYLAVDTRLGRKVALKLLPSSYTGDAERVRRFGQEARAASALNHPNIVTIHEIGQTDSLHFIATEFVDGETLREHITNTRMTVGEVVDVAAQIASALQAAHEAGIVHRDIKPENIMLRRDGFVKVLDFGLAKLAPDQAVVGDPRAPTKSMIKTNPGVVMGTVGYMSPEQARGAEVDSRTDVWSLGVVLYEMVAGHAPFEGETPSHVIVSILEGTPPPLAHNGEVLIELGRIISKALHKERVQRYQTAGDLARDLKKLKEELTVESRLKQFQRSHANMSATTKSNGLVASNTAQTSGTATTGVALRSTAEYLVNGIKHHRGSTVFASVSVILVIGFFAYFSKFTNETEAIDSVAVLHFVNEGGDSQTEYLADGLSDSVINSLTGLPNLRVVSLSSVLRYKGKQVDPQVIGRELNVRAVLVGTMAQRGSDLTISAELVDVRDNRRMWGVQYNRKPSDILAVQEEISREIAEKLSLKVGGTEKQRLTKQYTKNAEAYDAFLRGRFMLEKRTGPATYKGIEYLEQATKLDPNYALAYAWLNYGYWSLRTLTIMLAKEEWLPKAKAAAAKALEIDDTLAEAHTALGRVRIAEGDLTGAEIAYKRSIELNPNSGFVLTNYAHFLMCIGRSDEGIDESKRAVELEPTSVLYNRNVGMHLYHARRYDEAIVWSLKTIELDPNMTTAYRWLARSYEQKKLYDQAVEAYLKTMEFGPEVEVEFRDAYATSGWNGFWRKSLDLKNKRAKKGKISLFALAETYVRLGELDQAFDVLEKANRPMSPDPFWDGFRSDPRYLDLVRRMGLYHEGG